MDNCLVIPDSYKGILSAVNVSTVMEKSIKERFPRAKVLSFPIADGGEGTVDCFLHAWPCGEKIKIKVHGPFGEIVDSFYGIFNEIAVIEMAAAAGFGLCKKMDPLTASTYGVGELIKDSIKKGCKTIIVGLGGSCTNDWGTGMAAALDTKFYNEKGIEFVPVGGTLSKVKDFDNSATENLLKGMRIRAMCDVNNPVTGRNGATYIFGPQKGAVGEIANFLEKNMVDFTAMVSRKTQKSISKIKSGGAAGGLGAGAYVFLHASLEKGIDVILDIIKFEKEAAKCDVILTGEGRLDRQSLNGKAVIGISQRAKSLGVPVIAVVGSLQKNMPDLKQYGLSAVYETSESGLPQHMTGEELRNYSINKLKYTMDNIDFAKVDV